MATKSLERKLYYRSRPDWQRPAVILTMFVLSASWTFSLILLIAAGAGLLTASANVAIFAMILTVSIILIGYLAIFTKKYVDDLTQKYEFELLDNEIRLRIDDRVSGGRLFAHMPYSEISFVEHYTPRDNASLVFHGRDDRIIEVPIWSMMDDASPILDFLNDKRIKILQL